LREHFFSSAYTQWDSVLHHCVEIVSNAILVTGILSSLFELIIRKSVAATGEVGLGSAEACSAN